MEPRPIDTERTPHDYEQALGRLDEFYTNQEGGEIDGVDVVGVLAGTKPVSHINYSPELTGLMADLGIRYTVFSHPAAQETAHMTISNDPDLATEAAKLFLKQPELTDEEERRLGKLLGYPETGTDYYIKRNYSVRDTGKLLPIIQPKRLEGTIHDEFIECHLSKDHWREELDNFVFPLEKATQELMPQMYKKMKRNVRKRKLSGWVVKLTGGEPHRNFEPDQVEYVD